LHYNLEGANTFTNESTLATEVHAKLDATYNIASQHQCHRRRVLRARGFRNLTPTTSLGGISGLRQEAGETGYRVELSKMLSKPSRAG
jgi:hypothetical protein